MFPSGGLSRPSAGSTPTRDSLTREGTRVLGGYASEIEARPRIEPLSPPYEPDLERLLVRMTGREDIEPLKLFRTLAVHEEITSRMRPLGAALLAHPTIDPRDREIVIHRMTARCGAEYEWGVHAVAFGRPLGLDDAQLAATVPATPATPPGHTTTGCWSSWWTSSTRRPP